MFVDLTQSEVSGTGIQNLIAFVTASVVVTAKDSSGTLITTGGETIYLELHNECTLDSDYNWVDDVGAKQIFSSPVVTTMTDWGNGTYTYDYSIEIDGTVTVFIYQTSYVDVKYYGTFDWTGTYYSDNIETLYDDILDSEVPSGNGDHASAEYRFNLTAPYSETFDFRIFYNDNGS